MNDENLLSELIVESKDHLAAIEPDLLAMEKGGQVPPETINRIFRAVHSIKGGFGFFGLENIKALSHSMENVMVRVRNGALPMTSAIVDAFLAGVDKLRVMLDDVRRSDQISYDDVASKLAPFLDAKEVAPSHGNGAAAVPMENLSLRQLPVSRDELLAAARHGKNLYAVRVRLKTDLEWKGRTALDLLREIQSFGELHDSWLDLASITGLDNCLDKELAYTLVISSVLETDLMTEALHIDPSQVRAFPKKTIPAELGVTSAPKPSATAKPAQAQASAATAAEQPQVAETVRVRVELLNKLVNLAGELVLSRNQLMQRLKNEDELGLKHVLQNVDLVTSELQESILNTRMQPIGSIFGKLPRMVRDLSKSLGKEIDLSLSGENVELDKSILEALMDPLTHLVRNCVDHGIEPPAERQAVAKPAAGRIALRAFHEGGQVNIEIRDDGRGINIERIRAKALENGLLTKEQAQGVSDKELHDLMFEPGFSTAEKVTEISGRGVGLDVVKTNIEKLGGLVEVGSQVGRGTTFTLKLPLTLAIIPSLIVTCEDRRFAVPQTGLDELVRLRAGDVSRRIEKVQGKDVLRLRGKLLPLVRLNELLKIPPTFVHPQTGERLADGRKNLADRRQSGQEKSREQRRSERADRRQSWKSAINIVVLKVGHDRFGLIVESLIDTEEIVVKPLSEYVVSCKCYAGATIMGDGKVAMILDPIGISHQAGLRFSEVDREALYEQDRVERELNRQDILLFDNGTPERFGVELADIARIEKIQCSGIERVGEKEFLRSGDVVLQLIRLHQHLPVTAPQRESSSCFVIVPKRAQQPCGIVASNVQDFARTKLVLDRTGLRAAGLKGSALIQSALTLILDVEGLSKVLPGPGNVQE